MNKVFLIIALLFSILSWAGNDKDKSKEIGFAVGTGYYLGELNRTHFGGELKLGGGLFYRQNIDRRWSFNFGVHYFELGAYDSKSKDPWKVNRNLHFKNPILETSAIAELNFFPYQVGSKQDFFTPFLFLGIAHYSMKPMAEYNGAWYELQPLGTEGQGTSSATKAPYKVGGLSLPYGFGIKMNITGGLAFNITYGMRSASSDYIDDVSTAYADPLVLRLESGVLTQELSDRSLEGIGLNDSNAFVERGDPTNNDFYAFTTFALTLRIDKKPGSCWGGR